MTARALALTLFLASCVSPPEVRHPDVGVEAPDDWTAREGHGDIVEETWWRQFGDPKLDQLVEEALLNNFDLEVAAARLEMAMAQARIAGADFYPNLDFAFDGSRQKINFFGIPIPGRDDIITARFNQFGATFSTSWELDVWGRIRAGKKAAVAEVQAAEADIRAARQSIAAQVCLGWFAAVEAKQQLELAQATVDSYRNSAEWIEERYNRGLRPPLDLRLTLSDLSTAEAILERRTAELDSAVRQLEILLSRYPSRSIDATDDLPPVPDEIPAGLPAELVSRRPDLVRAERQLAADESRVEQAKAALYPRLSLTASGGTASDEIGDILSGDFSVWTIGGNLLLPLFEGGRLRANVDLAESRSREGLAFYALTLLSAFAEVESSLAAEGILTRRENNLRAAAEQAREARTLAEEQYRAGLTGPLLLLESQRTEFAVESRLLEVRRQRLEERVRLHLALGGDFGESTLDEVSDTSAVPQLHLSRNEGSP